MEGNAEIEEHPPAEHGIGLAQWMASKREALSCRREPDVEFWGGAVANAETRDRTSGACEEQAKYMSEQRDISTKQLQLGTAVLANHRAEEESQRATSSFIPNTSPSLQQVLQGDIGPPFHLAALRAFTAAEFTEENIDFLLEVNQFKMADDTSLQKSAASLCSRFVAAGAPKEINLSGAVRMATMANVQRLPSQVSTFQGPTSTNICPLKIGMLRRNVFDQAQQQIYALTESDVFPRFVQSINAQMQG